MTTTVCDSGEGDIHRA